MAGSNVKENKRFCRRSTGVLRKKRRLGALIKLHRSNISGVTCKPKQGCHTLDDQAASINDHIELHIAGHQCQMECPDDSCGTKRYQEETAQRQQACTDRARTSQTNARKIEMVFITAPPSGLPLG